MDSAPTKMQLAMLLSGDTFLKADRLQFREVIRRQATWLLVPFLLAGFVCAEGQFELPDEIFSRTLLVRSGNELATAFKFDQGDHVYLVTTRHVCKNLPPKNAVIKVWHGSWLDLQTVRTIFPSAADLDLAILETNERIGRPYKVVKSSEVLTTGQKVWYMGWSTPIPHPKIANAPHTSRPLFPEIPMVSIGTISAIEATQADSYQIHFDGNFYNNRIATGPVVYWSSSHRDFEVLGVIKRNERDSLSISINGGAPEDVVKANSLKVYSIDVVMDTIRNDPQP